MKYLEQIIIPLKKAHYIESVRGRKGGHILTKPPEEITVGEIVALLEESSGLVKCAQDTTVCERADICPTRLLWKEAYEAMFDRLEAVTLADLVERAEDMESQEVKPGSKVVIKPVSHPQVSESSEDARLPTTSAKEATRSATT